MIPRIPIPSELKQILVGLTEPVELIDEAGNFAGTFVPRRTEGDVSPDAVIAHPQPMPSAPDELQRVSIRIAGNTGYPCLLAALAKGYRVWIEYTKLDKPVLHWDEYMPDYRAELNGAYFSATSAEELLGLIAMHEVRGDGWRHWEDGELEAVERIHDTARTYDTDGNLLPDE